MSLPIESVKACDIRRRSRGLQGGGERIQNPCWKSGIVLGRKKNGLMLT